MGKYKMKMKMEIENKIYEIVLVVSFNRLFLNSLRLLLLLISNSHYFFLLPFPFILSLSLFLSHSLQFIIMKERNCAIFGYSLVFVLLWTKLNLSEIEADTVQNRAEPDIIYKFHVVHMSFFSFTFGMSLILIFDGFAFFPAFFFSCHFWILRNRNTCVFVYIWSRCLVSIP